MLEKNSIEKKIAEIDDILRQIEGGEIALGDIAVKYREAVSKFRDLEKDLDEVENQIKVIEKDFSKE